MTKLQYIDISAVNIFMNMYTVAVSYYIYIYIYIVYSENSHKLTMHNNDEILL